MTTNITSRRSIHPTIELGPRKPVIGVIRYFAEELGRAVEGSTPPGALKPTTPRAQKRDLADKRVNMAGFEIK